MQNTQEHVVVQCPLSTECFVRVSVWGKPTQEAIELLMEILQVQMKGGVFPTEEILQQHKISLPPTPQEDALEQVHETCQQSP